MPTPRAQAAHLLATPEDVETQFYEALREADRYQEAFDALERGLAMHPNDKELLYARALALRGDTDG